MNKPPLLSKLLVTAGTLMSLFEFRSCSEDGHSASGSNFWSSPLQRPQNIVLISPISSTLYSKSQYCVNKGVHLFGLESVHILPSGGSIRAPGYTIMFRLPARNKFWIERHWNTRIMESRFRTWKYHTWTSMTFRRNILSPSSGLKQLTRKSFFFGDTCSLSVIH
jgi:hypothetical protein